MPTQIYPLSSPPKKAPQKINAAKIHAFRNLQIQIDFVQNA